MNLVDTHIHLYEYDNVDLLISEAMNNDVIAIFCVSEDLETSIESLELSRRYRGFVYPLIGIHPWTATYHDVKLEEFAWFLRENKDKIIGIGEVGLDWKYVEETSRDRWKVQLRVFKFMLELAEELRLPVQVHSRRAVKEALDIISTYNIPGVQFHWFSGDAKMLKEVIGRGYYVSFTPSVTYSKKVMEIASIVPPDLVLTETDGPIKFFGKFIGQTTKPHFVRDVVIKLSELLSTDPEELSKQIIKNVRTLYKINISSK